MSKKGQEGTSTGTIIGVLIGFLLLVVMGYFIYNFFGTLDKGRETFTPNQIDIKVQACKAFVSVGAKESFCNFQELEKNTYLNCDHDKVKEALINEDYDISGLNCEKTPEQYCRDTKTNKGDNFNDQITVNGEKCVKLGVSK